MAGRRVGYATYHARYRSVWKFISEGQLKPKIDNTLLSAEDRLTHVQERPLSLNVSTYSVPNNAYQMMYKIKS
jgi:hypothetical protein